MNGDRAPGAQDKSAEAGRDTRDKDKRAESPGRAPREEPAPQQQQHEAECERLLRNAKRQVKQMMEEAVTRKFIHEESSSIISLCVTIDACLSHQLKRRALGLFKTNSSTALVQKAAKVCPEAREIMLLVEAEERRQEEELKQAQARELQRREQESAAAAAAAAHAAGGGVLSSNGQRVPQQPQPQPPLALPPPAARARSPLKQVASNYSVHRRNMWIKCALFEKKLVPIVEFLAENAHKYYEPEALMASPVSAQLLCALLVGPSALEFSRSKSSDFYQHEDPSAAELLRRHKLSNPIACLCHQQQQQQQRARNGIGGGGEPAAAGELPHTQQVARSWSNSSGSPAASSAAPFVRSATDCAGAATSDGKRARASSASTHSGTASAAASAAVAADAASPNRLARGLAGQRSGSSGAGARRRPLALRTNLKTGALVTECHHYSCQEISEHQRTRGYSFKSASGSCQLGDSHACELAAGAGQGSSPQLARGNSTPPIASGPAATPQNQLHQEGARTTAAAAHWPLWSPRMLHETLHQNSRSSLLYAKNNILLETQAHGPMAGYLSLHHQLHSSDLILKWIPNQLINGGHNSTGAAAAAGADSEPRAANGCSCQTGGGGGGSTANTNGAADESPPSEAGPQEATASAAAPAAAAAPAPSTMASGSYLDLVINLSVSRIVLLHCHFNGAPAAGPPATEQVDRSEGEQTGGEQQSQGSQQSQRQRPANPLADIEETLILVEADGVQRAPFRFPKGGLRWFLSCLETGLRPARFLEPAMGPDEEAPGEPHGSAQEATSAAAAATASVDPLQMLRPLESSHYWTPNGCLESPSACGAGACSEPAAAGASRFDALLRRLPSLKRTSRPTAPVAPSRTPQVDEPEPASPANSRVASPSPSESSPPPPRARPLNYVYRIVSAQPADWPLATPPLSALSVASSSSGSLAYAAASCRAPLLTPGAETARQQQQQQAAAEGAQRFRWSLSRLARFSSRAGSSSSTSSAVAACAAKSTIESVESLSQQHQQVGPDGAALSMRRDSSSELIRIEAKLSDLKKSSTEELVALRDQSIACLCESMRKQILARAFYGWLAYCRRMKIIRTHLADLLLPPPPAPPEESAGRRHSQQTSATLEPDAGDCNDGGGGGGGGGLTRELWTRLMSERQTQQQLLQRRQRRGQNGNESHGQPAADEQELRRRVCALVYRGGVADDHLRREVWPYLLGHYAFGESAEARRARDERARDRYQAARREWAQIERVIRQRDSELLAANMAKVARRQRRAELAAQAAPGGVAGGLGGGLGCEPATSETTESSLPWLGGGSGGGGGGDGDGDDGAQEQDEEAPDGQEHDEEEDDDDDEELAPLESAESGQPQADESNENENKNKNSSNNHNNKSQRAAAASGRRAGAKRRARAKRKRRFRLESTGSLGSDASITDQFGNNIHRIDKDVQRCDRSFWYFREQANLDKLRTLMCSYVWQHLDVGYVQGMCDLAAPILVVFEPDELMAHECFNQLMKRMVANFPQGSAMDKHFEHLKYLMQVLDPKLFEVLQSNGDYTHFYFCYRWLLLDFKRELVYEDVYRVWETIWAARHVASKHFVVFLALAMVRFYRDIIIENNMDFTDTIKFFNEMAERHDAKKIIALAQDCVLELESLMWC